MTRRHTLRLVLAGAAGVAIALLSAVAMGAPAGATGPLQTGSDTHQPSISIKFEHATCLGAEGKRAIDWKITNSGQSDATVTEVTTAPQGQVDLNGIVLFKNKFTVVTEKVPASAHSATLTVKAAWDKDTDSNRKQDEHKQASEDQRLDEHGATPFCVAVPAIRM